MPTIVSWEVVEKSAHISRDNLPNLILSIGDCFTFDYESVKRSEDDICVVTQFTGYKEKSGPIGFNYLPWRVKENCWGSEQWSLRGDIRHIICMPCGIAHIGQHINWETFQIVNGIDHIEFNNYIKQLKYTI